LFVIPKSPSTSRAKNQKKRQPLRANNHDDPNKIIKCSIFFVSFSLHHDRRGPTA
jgi:hypothetical protein